MYGLLAMVIFICNLSVSSVQMSAMKAANKDLKGTMKTLKIDDIDVWRFHKRYSLPPFFSAASRTYSKTVMKMLDNS